MLKRISFGSALPYLEIRHDKQPKRSLVLTDRSFEFKPGLNMLVGANGSGKSTLLEAIAKRFLCFNFGTPNLDKETFGYMSELWQEDEEHSWRDHKFLPYVTAEYDQVPYMMYASPEFTPLGQPNRAYAMCYGLGKAATEHYDMVDSHSSGEGMRNVMAKMFNILRGAERPINRNQVQKHDWRDERDSGKRQVNWLDQNILPQPDAPMVLLLDEPERALDLQAQLAFWADLTKLTAQPNVQVIIATHSIIPLFMPDIQVNYVEMTKGYADSLRTGVEKLNK